MIFRDLQLLRVSRRPHAIAAAAVATSLVAVAAASAVVVRLVPSGEYDDGLIDC